MTKSILIVEDDPFIAMDLQDTFEDAGYEVLGPVAAVDAGLKLVKEKTPDIAMLDYNLGHETSIPLANALEKKDIPYLFVSGQVETVITQGRTQAHPVIKKPFNTIRLLSKVSEIVNDNKDLS